MMGNFVTSDGRTCVSTIMVRRVAKSDMTELIRLVRVESPLPQNIPRSNMAHTRHQGGAAILRRAPWICHHKSP
jgi:hypothetical protein